MKVLCATKPGSDINALIDCGMDETYVGLEDTGWNIKFGPDEYMNKMSEFGLRANFPSLEKISEMIKSCKRNIPFYLTVNSHMYNSEQIDYIEDICNTANSYGISGFIVGDPVLMERLCRNGYYVIASTIAGAYNRNIVRFFKELGISRTILPRDMSLESMESITTAVDMDYEAFIYGNGCRFSDSACLGYHSVPNPLCWALDHKPATQIPHNGHINEREKDNFNLFHHVFHHKSCGICAIYRMNNIGIGSVKIVGRADSPEFNRDCCSLIKQCITLANESKTEKEYLDSVKQFRTDCQDGLYCYYPEVLNNE